MPHRVQPHLTLPQRPRVLRVSVGLLFLVPWAMLFIRAPSLLAEAETTEPLWRKAMEGQAIGAVSAQGESVAVVCDDGTLKLYSSRGNRLWTFEGPSKLMPHIRRSAEGTSYIGTENGFLMAINRAGRELWRRKIDGPLRATPAIGWDGRVFVATDTTIFAFTPGGTRLWSGRIPSAPMTDPVVDGEGKVVMVLSQGRIGWISPYGELRTLSLSAVPSAVCPYDEAPDTVLAGFPDGSLIIAAQDGRIQSLPRLPAKPLGLIHRGSLVAAVLEDGSVFCVDIKSQNILWKGQGPAVTGDQVRMLFDERGVYVLTSAGAAGFSADGRRLWFVGLQGAAVVCSFSDEGILYSGGKDWVLYAYRVEQRVRSQKASPEVHRYGLASSGPSVWADDPFGYESPLLDQRLGSIAEDINRGQVGTQERSYTAYLLEILDSSVGPGNSHSPTHPAVLPSYRFRAAELLGPMASREVVPNLIAFFNAETDPLVRSALAIALGRVGGGTDGEALKALWSAVTPPQAVTDERLLMGILQATAELCAFSGPPFSDVGVGILMNLSTDDRPSRVRSAAKRELLALFTRTN